MSTINREELEKDLNFLLDEARTIVVAPGAAKPEIVDDEQNELASAIEVRLRERINLLEETRKTMKAPYLEKGREIDEFFNPRIKKLQTAKDFVHGLGKDYWRRKEEKRLELQRALQAEEEKKERELRQKAIEEAKAKGQAEVELPTVQRTEIEETAKVVKTEVGQTTFRKSWTYEITDLKALFAAALKDPQLMKYVQANEVEIGKDVRKKDGIRELAGVRIFQDII